MVKEKLLAFVTRIMGRFEFEGYESQRDSNKSFHNKEAIIACALVLIMQTYKRKY